MSYLYKFILILIFIIINLLQLNSLNNKNWDEEKSKAEKLYNSGKYEEAIILFREINLSSENEKLKAEMYIWLAKAYMGSGDLEQAEKNIEYYLKNYELSGLNYPEAVYEKGRLLFLQEQYQDSISQFNKFIKKYPLNKLVSNAYYWIGECLYALGQFDDSAFYFNIVINKYPKSIKKDASEFKLRLIEHKKSELVLQNLLKWSQEQYLSALNQFRIREKTLQEALEKYKNQDFSKIDAESLKNYEELDSQNKALKEQISMLEQKIKEIEGNITDKYLVEKLKQIELKEELLKSKEETLKILEEELRKKEKSLESK